MFLKVSRRALTSFKLKVLGFDSTGNVGCISAPLPETIVWFLGCKSTFNRWTDSKTTSGDTEWSVGAALGAVAQGRVVGWKHFDLHVNGATTLPSRFLCFLCISLFLIYLIQWAQMTIVHVYILTLCPGNIFYFFKRWCFKADFCEATEVAEFPACGRGKSSSSWWISPTLGTVNGRR